MTGREKIEAAFSQDGTPEIPVVICYEDIYIRDHWDQISSCPWWYRAAPDIRRQLEWRREVITQTGQDWFQLSSCAPEEAREHQDMEIRSEGVFRVDRRSGDEELMKEPTVGGWDESIGLHSHHPEHMLETPEEIDARIPMPPAFDADEVKRDGRSDLATELLTSYGTDLYPTYSVSSPFWCCYSVWGFEGMMMMVATRPDLVAHACQRYLARTLYDVRMAAALGAKGIWIEECLTDMIGPEAFASLNVPYLTQVVDAIRAEGMHSIYYYCGDPEGKWDHLLGVGADALSLEESKKGFMIDIEHVVDQTQGRCSVLGNLDAMDLLQNGSEEQLRNEITRQIAAGRRNGSRFIMSVGSPVTPGTSPERVRLYCDLVHELGRIIH